MMTLNLAYDIMPQYNSVKGILREAKHSSMMVWLELGKKI